MSGREEDQSEEMLDVQRTLIAPIHKLKAITCTSGISPPTTTDMAREVKDNRNNHLQNK